MSQRDWLEVFERVQKGDRVALVELTSLITGQLRRSNAYGVRDSWSDVVQEVLIKLIRASRQGQIDRRESFVAYVGTTTRHCMIDWLRKNAKYHPIIDRDGTGDGSGSDDRSAARFGLVTRDHPEQRSDVETALQQLPEAQRRVLVAIYLEGQSYEEASAALEVPLGSLKRHQTQGLKALREWMGLGSPSP